MTSRLLQSGLLRCRRGRGEVATVIHYLTHLGMLTTLGNQVLFARKRFGIFEVIDFVTVLIGYAALVVNGRSPTITIVCICLRRQS